MKRKKKPHNCGGWCEKDDMEHKAWCKKLHPGSKYGHWCEDWDGLWTCERCAGWETCYCYGDPKLRDAIVARGWTLGLGGSHWPDCYRSHTICAYIAGWEDRRQFAAGLEAQNSKKKRRESSEKRK